MSRGEQPRGFGSDNTEIVTGTSEPFDLHKFREKMRELHILQLENAQLDEYRAQNDLTDAQRRLDTARINIERAQRDLNRLP